MKDFCFFLSPTTEEPESSDQLLLSSSEEERHWVTKQEHEQHASLFLHPVLPG